MRKFKPGTQLSAKALNNLIATAERQTLQGAGYMQRNNGSGVVVRNPRRPVPRHSSAPPAIIDSSVVICIVQSGTVPYIGSVYVRACPNYPATTGAYYTYLHVTELGYGFTPPAGTVILGHAALLTSAPMESV